MVPINVTFFSYFRSYNHKSVHFKILVAKHLESDGSNKNNNEISQIVGYLQDNLSDKA